MKTLQKLLKAAALFVTAAMLVSGCGNPNNSVKNGKQEPSVPSNGGVGSIAKSSEVGVKSITVKGVAAVQDTVLNAKYMAILPAEELEKVKSSDIVIVLKDANASNTVPEKNTNGTWSFTVTAENGTAKTYTLILAPKSTQTALLKEITATVIDTVIPPYAIFKLVGDNFTAETKNKIKCKVKKGAGQYIEQELKSNTFNGLATPPTYTVEVSFDKNTTMQDVIYSVIFSVDGGTSFNEPLAKEVKIPGKSAAESYSITVIQSQQPLEFTLPDGNLQTKIIVMVMKDGGGSAAGLSNDKIKVGVFLDGAKVTVAKYKVEGDKAKKTITITFPQSSEDKTYTVKVNATGSEDEFQSEPVFTVTVKGM